MLHEPEFRTLDERVADLNRAVAGFDPMRVLKTALDPRIGTRTALVSSFGAESVVLLKMVSLIDPRLPILFIDTEMLFGETLTYQAEVARHLGLVDVRIIRPDPADLSGNDPHGVLHEHDKDACCALRKTHPLQRALSGFDTWITGRKRFQSGIRATLEFFETDGDQGIKVNPLAHWRPDDLSSYLKAHRLPRHPKVAEGFASIGCAPCTSRIKAGEDTRAGRWRGSDKTECGIHFTTQRRAS